MWQTVTIYNGWLFLNVIMSFLHVLSFFACLIFSFSYFYTTWHLFLIACVWFTTDWHITGIHSGDWHSIALNSKDWHTTAVYSKDWHDVDFVALLDKFYGGRFKVLKCSNSCGFRALKYSNCRAIKFSNRVCFRALKWSNREIFNLFFLLISQFQKKFLQF